MKRIGRLATVALAAICVAAGSAAAYADVLILRSVGPSAGRYKAGQRLPDNARLVLRPGDVVALLRSGGTRVFRGPGSFGVDAAPTQSTSLSRGARVDAGAVRGIDDLGAIPRPDDLWHVDATAGGRACFIPGSQVVLWRPSANRRGSVSVRTRSGATTRLDWPARAQTLKLPLNAAADGSTVSYDPAGTAGATQVSLAELKLASLDRNLVGPALLAARCHNQLAHFIALNEERAE